MMNLFGFTCKAKVGGWEFNAFIRLKKDPVAYKLSGGKPDIDERIDGTRSPGPLQQPGGDRWVRTACL